MTVVDVKPGDYFIFYGKTFMKGTPGEHKEVRIIDPASGEILTLPKNGEVIPVFRKNCEEEYVEKNSLLKFLYEKVEDLTYEELEGATAMIYFAYQFPTIDAIKREEIDEKTDDLHKLIVEELHRENVSPELYRRIFDKLKAF